MVSPLVPPDIDLRDFSFMPVDIGRLFGSEFHARSDDAAWRAGVTLWLKSYHQVPAASIPDDDVALARLAELGRDVKGWRQIMAAALRGWIKCDDGRLYHPVVAEKALEGWLEKLGQRKSSAAGNAARYKQDFDPSSLDAAIEDAVGRLSSLNPSSRLLSKRIGKQPKKPPDGKPETLPSGSQGTGKGQGRDNIPSPEKGDTPKPRDNPPSFEASCRKAVGQEPVLLDHKFSALAAVLEDGATQADVLAGITAAMATPDFRIKHWSQLVGWAKRAAKDRLAGIPRSAATLAGKPSEKSYDFGGDRKYAESFLISVLQNPSAYWRDKFFDGDDGFHRAVDKVAPDLLKFWKPSPVAEKPPPDPRGPFVMTH